MIELSYPFQEIYPITQSYSSSHPAVDWGAALHSPVLAAAAGRVQTIRFQSAGYGLYIVLEHQDKSSTLYAHLDEVLVAVGDIVAEGQIIAYSGSSGHSTGPHLHFEYRLDGKKAIDPIPHLKALAVLKPKDAYEQPKAERFTSGEKVILKEEFDYVNIRPIPAFGSGVVDIGDYCGGAAVEVLEQQGDMVAIKVWIHSGYVRRVVSGERQAYGK
ncbi:MAG: M23 family metallopeptidase [Anaerolineales bacterium]